MLILLNLIHSSGERKHTELQQLGVWGRGMDHLSQDKTTQQKPQLQTKQNEHMKTMRACSLLKRSRIDLKEYFTSFPRTRIFSRKASPIFRTISPRFGAGI